MSNQRDAVAGTPASLVEVWRGPLVENFFGRSDFEVIFLVSLLIDLAELMSRRSLGEDEPRSISRVDRQRRAPLVSQLFVQTGELPER